MAAKTVVGVTIMVDGQEKVLQSMGEIRKELKAASFDVLKFSESFGAGSREATEAAKRVANLKDAIGDAKAVTDSFNPDKKFVALGGALTGVVAGFNAIQGGLGLIMPKSKEVEAALLKVQSAMALQQGISGIMGAVDSFKLLAVEIKGSTAFTKLFSVATGIATAIQSSFGVAVDTTSLSFKILRGAIISTGIGALIVALGFVVTKIMDWAESTNTVTKSTEQLKKEEDNLNASIKATNDTITKQNELWNYQTELSKTNAKIKGQNSEEIRQIERENLIRQRDDAIIYEQIASDRLLNSKNETAATKKILEDDLNNKTEVRQKYFQQINLLDANNKLLEIQENKDKNVKIIAAEEKRNAEAKKLQDEKIKNLKESLKKELAAEVTHFENKQEIDLQKKNLEEQAQWRITAARLWDEAEQSYFDDLDLQAAINHAADKKTIDAAELSAKLEFWDQVGNGLGALGKLFDEGTAASKVFALSEIAVNTATAYMRGLSIAQQSASATGPAAAFSMPIFYAGQIAAILGAVGKAKGILATVKGGSGGVGGNLSAPTIPTVSAPISAQAQTTMLDQNSINQIGNAAIHSYVLESDVSGNQERVRRLNRAARIN